ncbi:MAG: pirin-like C-terminal cupin domain-containing protein [Pseudomonadota bacterium]
MITRSTTSPAEQSASIGPTHSGAPLRIGTGFVATSFRQQDFDGLMDPLVMVDHYTMSESTFGAHPHAGMSAVSVLFEDSEGVFRNRDSLGNDIALHPGDLYWLRASSGAMHDEAPVPGARTHGLQLFVNLPAHLKGDRPASLHVPAGEMPVIENARYRVRVVLGESNGVVGAQSPALPFTILDVQLRERGTFIHDVPIDMGVWLHAIEGNVQLSLAGQHVALSQGQALALRSGLAPERLGISSARNAQVVILQGAPLREPVVQEGPFVMATQAAVDEVKRAYEAGRFPPLEGEFGLAERT